MRFQRLQPHTVAADAVAHGVPILRTQHPRRMKPAQPRPAATVQGPPRRTGGAPLPAARSAARAGGRSVATQGGVGASSAQSQFEHRVLGAGLQVPLGHLVHEAHRYHEPVATDFGDQPLGGIDAQAQQLEGATLRQVLLELAPFGSHFSYGG